jgi:hypothetical protein
MAVTETRQLVNPTLEASLTNFLKKVDPLVGQQINTSSYAPQVASQNALQTGAVSAAGGLGSLVGTGAGTGEGSIASYMSPYQQQVMDASLSEFDRNAAIQQNALGDQAISMGAFGGGREGVQRAEMMRGSNMNRASLQAQLLNQGFQQAQQARSGDLAAQQGLGTYQQGLGQGQQGYQQALLDATQVANREQQYSPFTQIGLIGQQLSQMTPGTYPTTMTTTTPQSVAPTSPLQSYIGGAGAVGGILGKLLG